MGSSYITPSLLLVNGLEQLLVGNKAMNVRNQAEFIGSVSKHIDEETTQAVCSYLMFSFAQNQASRSCNRSQVQGSRQGQNSSFHPVSRDQYPVSRVNSAEGLIIADSKTRLRIHDLGLYRRLMVPVQRMDRLHNLLVSGTSAQISGDGFPYPLFIRLWI